jgi:hypothetical protein
MTLTRLPALVAGTVLVAAALVATTPSPAAADPPRTGYRLPADGTASGGWIGSRTASKRAVFRIDPSAKPRTGGFHGGAWASRLRGSGPVEVDRWRVRRAAWLVAKYGTYDSDSQAAAVEVALHHLLHGGRYALGGSATQRRLRRTGERETIAALTRYMLERSRDLAGPYRVRVTTTGAVLGSAVAVEAVVTTRRTGLPVPHLPVTVRYDGRTLTGTTDATGTAVMSATAKNAGPRPVRVTVGRVPSDRLFLRRPVLRSGSRVAVAGRKITLASRADVAVQAVPRVWVTAPDQRTTAGPVPGSLHLADGYPSARSATMTLHGPFAPGVEATCDPDLTAATTAVPVAADGAYPAPDVDVTAAGTYRWAVRVPADDYNVAAWRCGPTVLVKAAPTLTVKATASPVARREPAYAKVTGAGLPDDLVRDAIVRLYGPFSSRDTVRCASARQARWRSVTLTGPTSSARTDAVTLGTAGFYGWRAVLPATELTAKATTRCRTSGSILRVR